MKRPKTQPLRVCVGDDQSDRATTQYYAWFCDHPLDRGRGDEAETTFTLPGKRQGLDVNTWVKAQLMADQAAGHDSEDMLGVEDLLLLIIDAAFTAGAKYQAAKLKRIAAAKAAKAKTTADKPATKRATKQPAGKPRTKLSNARF